jgi:divalent metal cation (Fe/Co/Zn/Cd) transporter
VALIIAANFPNFAFLDSTAAIVGSLVIINWAYVLAVDTSANLVDLNPDMKLTAHLKARLEVKYIYIFSNVNMYILILDGNILTYKY